MKRKSETTIKVVHPLTLGTITLVIALLMVVLAFLEMRHSRRLITELVFQKGVALIDQIEKSGSLAIRAGEQIEGELALRLLSAARSIARLEGSSPLDTSVLQQKADSFQVKTFHLVGPEGDIELSNHPPDHFRSRQGDHFQDMYSDLFEGRATEDVYGLHEAPQGDGMRYSAAVARLNGGIVVASVDADVLTEFRRSFGLGRLIQDTAALSGVRYVVFQDLDGIIASSTGVREVSSIGSDPFLQGSFLHSATVFREFVFEGNDLFEVVRPIEVSTEITGLLRVAFDGHEIKGLEQKAQRRLILTVVVVFLILTLMVYMLVIYNNLKTVRQTRDQVVSLSDTILKGVADAVLVLAADGQLHLLNRRARELFDEQLTRLPEILRPMFDRLMASGQHQMEELNMVDRAGRTMHLLVSASPVPVTPSPGPYAVFLCHDVTEERRLQRHIRDNEKVVAMGKLAGAVAHEVRNPLNAIGMAVQRLDSLSIKAEAREKYSGLLQIVSEEISRLDAIISQFLTFARPAVIELSRVDLMTTVKRVVEELREVAATHDITLEISGPDQYVLDVDEKQLHQVLLNLMLNALDACKEKSETTPQKVTVHVERTGPAVRLQIEDTGRGMSPQERERVFDLYYTTKDRGTGLGLPISLKIIEAHHGTLDIASEAGHGTVVTITLPEELDKDES